MQQLQLEQLPDDLVRLLSRMSAIEKALNKFQESTGINVQEILESLSEQREEIEKLVAEASEGFEKKIAELASAITAQFEQRDIFIEGKIAELVKTDSSLLALIKELQLVDDALHASVEELQVSDLTMQADINKLREDVDNLITQMEEVQTLMAITEAEFQTLVNQVNINTQGVATNVSAIQAIHELLVKVDTTTTGLQTQINALSNRVSVLESNQLNIAVQNLSLDAMDENPYKTGIQISKDVPLPTTTANGGTLAWSSESKYISSDGVVTQPSYTEGDQVVQLTGHFTYGENESSKVFELVITAAAATDAEKVKEDALNLSLDKLDDVTNVSGVQVLGDKTLPAIGDVHGTTITWASSHPDVFSTTGVVTRPHYKSTSVIVTLTATVQSGAETETKEFQVTVIRNEPTDTEKVLDEKEALMVTMNPEANSITLPTTGSEFASNITWNSNSEYITSDGTVIQPSYTVGDVTVTLIATIVNGTASDTKEFHFLVEALPPTDIEKIGEDSADLTIDLELSDDITLPTAGDKHGSTITWESSDEEHLTADGKVTRPSYSEGDADVTLTATIEKNGETATKEFEVVVKFDPTTMDGQDRANEDAKLLSLNFADENVAKPGIQVSKNIALPKTVADGYGSTVTWETSNAYHITSAGIITRSSSSIGDQTVTLTATITNGEGSTTKQFSVTVLAY